MGAAFKPKADLVRWRLRVRNRCKAGLAGSAGNERCWVRREWAGQRERTPETLASRALWPLLAARNPIPDTGTRVKGGLTRGAIRTAACGDSGRLLSTEAT